MHKIQLKRVYDDFSSADGFRILVDRLWPRGVKKEALPYDLWAKEITPSSELRKQFNHQPEKFKDFRKSYLHELTENETADSFIQTVKEQLANQKVTLLYAAKDTKYNHVVVLKEWLEKQVH